MVTVSSQDELENALSFYSLEELQKFGIISFFKYKRVFTSEDIQAWAFLSKDFYFYLFFYFILFYFFKDFIFFLFLPKAPLVHSCIFFVVGPSSCGMWDAASVWFDEQCHVHAQDSKQRNTGPPAAEHVNLTTRPRGQPQDLGFCCLIIPLLCWNLGRSKNYATTIIAASSQNLGIYLYFH